jgi:hypothetical protein
MFAVEKWGSAIPANGSTIQKPGAIIGGDHPNANGRTFNILAARQIRAVRTRDRIGGFRRAV